jgi:outer membrane lipoprotein-sorting protein
VALAIIIGVLVLMGFVLVWVFATQGENERVAQQLERAAEDAKSIEERQLEVLEKIHREQKKRRPHLNFRR